MKLILVCVDFSDVSGRVVKLAAGWASRLGAALHLLHVVPPPPPLAAYAPGSGMALPVPGVATVDLAAEKARLEDYARNLGVTASSEVAEGPVLTEILEAAERIDAEAVVLGSHGHGALYELLVGSVTEGILRRSRRPVWVVPARGATSAA